MDWQVRKKVARVPRERMPFTSRKTALWTTVFTTRSGSFRHTQQNTVVTHPTDPKWAVS